jgi:VWFA-related protein
MPASRLILAGVLCTVLFGQAQEDPAGKAPDNKQPETQPLIRTTVDFVVAPVTVLDRNGDYVDGLRPDQFHLFDNEKEQDIKVDVAFQPISMVIAVQANDQAESVLPQIQKIGVMIEPIVIGAQGEAAVVAFDSRIRELQEFTSDTNKITEALKKIHPGSSQSRMIDAVDTSVRLLRTRPQNRRRLILLISETRDKSSEGRVREALIAAQLANVSVYSVDISRMITSIMGRPQPPRPDNRPPAMTPLPSRVPATPTTVMQSTGRDGSSAQFIPLMVEIFKDVKSIFVDNPVEVFTKGTGGEQFGFYRQRGLEEAIEKIGAELHSQYMLSYNPNNKDEGGFHEISVDVSGRRGVTTRTRPGYWLAAK